jgi:hypothetical protein
MLRTICTTILQSVPCIAGRNGKLCRIVLQIVRSVPSHPDVIVFILRRLNTYRAISTRGQQIKNRRSDREKNCFLCGRDDHGTKGKVNRT